jgi:hypothetical protein
MRVGGVLDENGVETSEVGAALSGHASQSISRYSSCGRVSEFNVKKMAVPIVCVLDVGERAQAEPSGRVHGRPRPQAVGPGGRLGPPISMQPSIIGYWLSGDS